jgi:FixJ family two-component response regulator
MGGESDWRWSDVSAQRPSSASALEVTKLPALIHVVDDDESFRTSLGRLLRTCGYEVALYESAKPLLERLPYEGGPSCLLLDVQIPGLSGPELQDRLAELGSSLPIVFLTGHGDIPTTVQAIKGGAEDFLTKPVPKAKLLDAIERALAKAQSSLEQHNRLIGLRTRVAALTPREREVFERVVRGKLNKEIAYELGTTERTIKAHRHQVMEKTQSRTLAELVSLGERLGIAASSNADTMKK